MAAAQWWTVSEERRHEDAIQGRKGVGTRRERDGGRDLDWGEPGGGEVFHHAGGEGGFVTKWLAKLATEAHDLDRRDNDRACVTSGER